MNTAAGSTVRLTVGQAIVRYLAAQYSERDASENEPALAATFRSSAYLGPNTEFVFDVAGTELLATMSGGGMSQARRGDEVGLKLKPAGLSLLPVESAKTLDD